MIILFDYSLDYNSCVYSFIHRPFLLSGTFLKWSLVLHGTKTQPVRLKNSTTTWPSTAKPDGTAAHAQTTETITVTHPPLQHEVDMARTIERKELELGWI